MDMVQTVIPEEKLP
jgi:hypothetical protein